jgi:hypothetical protein
VDGAGKRPAAGRKAGGLLPTISGGTGRFGFIAEDDSETRRQPLGLGGEIIRGLHDDPSLRKKSTEQILADRIDDEGGPLIYAMESEEQQQRSFDSTCKKLHWFLRPNGVR